MERRALAALTYKRSLPGERRDFKSCNLFSTDAPNKPPRKDRRAPSQRSQVPGETSCSAGERAPVGLVGRPQKQRPKTPGIPSQGNTVTVTSPSCKASSSAPSHLPRPATPPPSPTTHRVFSFLFFFPPEYFPPATRFSPPRTHGEKKNHDSGKHTHASCSPSSKPIPAAWLCLCSTTHSRGEGNAFSIPKCCLILTLQQGPHLGPRLQV